MDKKMVKVTRDIKKAESSLKKAEKRNVKLTKEDRDVRDPLIERAKKAGIK